MKSIDMSIYIDIHLNNNPYGSFCKIIAKTHTRYDRFRLHALDVYLRNLNYGALNNFIRQNNENF